MEQSGADIVQEFECGDRGTIRNISKRNKKKFRVSWAELPGEQNGRESQENVPTNSASGTSSGKKKTRGLNLLSNLQENGNKLRATTQSPGFEDILRIIGASGKWQLKVFVLASLSGFCTVMQNLLYTFIGPVPNHWCQLPNITDLKEEELKELFIPRINGEFSKCSRYSYRWNFNQSLVVDNTSTVECQNFQFDQSEFTSTVATEWQLVCSDSSWISTVQISYMAGILVGSLLYGAISDRLGRIYALGIASINLAFLAPLSALAPNFETLIVLRFFLALGSPGVYSTSYVLGIAIELFEEKMRARAGIYFNLPYAFGYVFLSVFAYFIRDWRILQLVVSIPCTILLVTWFFIPESPRWLIQKGKVKQAENVLRKASQMNSTETRIPADFSDMIKKTSEMEQLSSATGWKNACTSILASCFCLVKSPKIRVRFLVLCICWGTIGMCYYGLAMNSENVFANRYWYTLIGGFLEFPGFIIVPYLIESKGRKLSMIGLLVAAGICLLSSLFCPDGSYVVVYLNYIAKMKIGALFSVVYLYSSELLPTVVRAYGIGVASMMARIGAMVAPLVVDILGQTNRRYPSIIFGCAMIIAALAAIFLPETKGKHLPDTIEEVESNEVGEIETTEKKVQVEESV